MSAAKGPGSAVRSPRSVTRDLTATEALGRLVDKAEAVVSVFDHGLLYGDGVFEGIRSYSSCVFKLEEHIDRLYESARERPRGEDHPARQQDVLCRLDRPRGLHRFLPASIFAQTIGP